MASGRAKKNGARLSTELDSIAIGVTTEKADEFVQLFLHALGNKDIAVKLRAAMGVSQQLAGLQQEVHALRTELASQDARIETLQKKVDAIELQQDELEQYSRRNSVRLSGLTEEADEDVMKGVLVTLNHVMCITPPIDISEIDRMHRVGKPEANRTRPVLIKFATYRSKRRVLERRRFLNPAKRTEARHTVRDVMIGPETEEETQANHIQKQESRLYLNDDLTRSRSQLLYECRQAKKKQLISDCWSYDGSIIVKTLTHKISTIKTTADINSVSMHTIK